MGRIAPTERRLVRRRVDSLWEDVHRVEVTADLGYRAGDLADQRGLGAYDAVHLATLEQVAESDTVLVSADVELRQAAESLGVTVARLSCVTAGDPL